MNKKEFEMMLNNILTEIKDVPDDAEVISEYYTLDKTNLGVYALIKSLKIYLDYDDERFMTVENKKDCVNLKVVIVNEDF